MIDLQGKVAVMLGGMHELAGGVARSLGNAGAEIVLAHKPEDRDRAAAFVRELAGRGRAARAQEVSLHDPEALTQQVAALGRLHIAVISPDWYAFDDFLDTTPSDWDAALEHNFEWPVYAAQAVARHLIAQGEGGRIIFLSSVAGMLPLTQTSVVGTSLAALRVIARMAAVDLGQYGISVNVVAAGWVEAEWTKPYLTAEGRAYIERGIPLGRVGTGEDVGHLCCFLASDLAAYVTGAVIPVDGGYTLTKAEGNTPYPRLGTQ